MVKSTSTGYRYRYAGTCSTLVMSRIKSYLVFFVFTFLTANAFAQLAPVNPPSGGFAIDGGLRANTPTTPTPWAANQGDWVIGTPAATGTGGYVFTDLGATVSGLNANLKRDAYNSNSDIIFTEGSKFNADPNSWAWSSSTAPDKNDIHNGMYLVTKGTNSDDWLILGGDRLSTNGTSYIDFELLQKSVTRNTTNNKFTSAGTEGGRTVNDLVISMEYSNGGAKPNVAIYRWQLVSPGKYDYVLIPKTTVIPNTGGKTLADFAFAETNRTGTENVPFGAFGSNSYQQYAFVEAAVDMTKLLGAINPCLGINIKTIFIKTKASDSQTAALKDLMEPIPVTINFGAASISYDSPFCAAGTASPSYGDGSVLGGTFSAAANAGTTGTMSINTSTGVIDLANTPSGEYTVTYTFTTNGCQKNATATVTVNPKPTITGTLSVCVEATTALSGSGTAASSNAWTSSNTSVATVSNTGVVTGVSEGTATITYKNSSNCSQTATVTVNPKPTITGTLSVCVEATTALSGSGTAASSNAWTSSNTSVATVSNTGVVTGVSEGTATITYKNSSNCSQTATVTVNPKPTITGTLSVCVEATTALSGSGTAASSNAWTSSNTSVATVSNTGVVTGVSEGTATITYKNSSNCSQTATVTVNPKPTITGTLSVCVEATTALSGSGTAASSNAWTSSNTSVATVSNTGVVTGVSEGTATITYKNSSNCSQTATVTVNPKPTITGTLSVCVEATTALSGSGTAASSNAWTSSNTSVATVSNTGVVTGVSEGTATITYKNSSNCSQTATVTVNPKPEKPTVTYVPPTCTQTTFSVEIASPSAGTYTLRQLAGGVSSVSKVYPADAVDGKIVFTNLVIGKGYSVTRTYNGCTSLPEECGDFSALDAQSASSEQLQRISRINTNIETSTKVVAAPNPYNDRIRFNLQSAVSGQGSLELYNLMGQKVKTVYQGYIEAGRIKSIEYNVPNAQRSNLIYLFRVGDQRASGKLIH